MNNRNYFLLGFSLIELLISMSISAILLLTIMPEMIRGTHSMLHFAQYWSVQTDLLTLHEQLAQLFHQPRCPGASMRAYQHGIFNKSLYNEALELKLVNINSNLESCTTVRLWVGKDLQLSTGRLPVYSLFMQIFNGSKPEVLVSYVNAIMYQWGFAAQQPLWQQTSADLDFSQASRVRVTAHFNTGVQELTKIFIFNVRREQDDKYLSAKKITT